MEHNFRKKYKILPGITLNVGKKSSSFTIGKRGKSLNFNNSGIYANVGLSGTGISYRTKLHCNKENTHSQSTEKLSFRDRPGFIIWYLTTPSTHGWMEGRNKMLQREEELFKNHEAAICESVQTLETKFKNVVDGFKDVWVDKKTFNRYYWGFIGMLEIAIRALSLLLYYWVKFGAPWNC